MRWNERDAVRFLGCYLTEPKPAVHFELPTRPLGKSAFERAAVRRGLRLDTRTQLLYDGRHLFLNGDAMSWPRRSAGALKKLANERRLAGAELGRIAPIDVLYRWYRDGFLHLD